LYILEITEYVWYLSLNYKVNQKLFAAFDFGIVFIKRLHSFHNSFKAIKLICLCPLVSLETISRPRDISLDIIFSSRWLRVPSTAGTRPVCFPW